MLKFINKSYLICFLCCLCITSIIDAAKAQTPDSTPSLSGPWADYKDYLLESGIEVESILTVDTISNLSGGQRRATKTLGNFDLTGLLDTEKIGLWDSGNIFIYILGNMGGDPSSLVGDAQISDNIEAYDTLKVYEAWYEHKLPEQSLSLLFGLHDYNSEFAALDSAGTLINSSFGIQADIAQSVPSIFSTTSLAFRLKSELSENIYAQAAIYDGIPGDPDNQRGTRIRLNRDDGLFSALEFGFQSAENQSPFKLAFGAWLQTAKFEDFSGQERNQNAGIYSIGETEICHDRSSGVSLSIFEQIGFADNQVNQFANYLGAGFKLKGINTTRPDDSLSIGIAHARSSSRYKSELSEATSAETAVEATYRLELYPYLAIQPDLQYIINPGLSEKINDALVLGVRAELSV